LNILWKNQSKRRTRESTVTTTKSVEKSFEESIGLCATIGYVSRMPHRIISKKIKKGIHRSRYLNQELKEKKKTIPARTPRIA